MRKIALGYGVAFLVCLWVSISYAAETTETIAIREVFAKEVTGWKRGDVNLALSAYAPYFTGYNGAESADPADWRVCCENLDRLEERLTEEFSRTRYDIYRVPVYFNVSVPVAEKAIVVTEESGTRTDRGTGAQEAFEYTNLWTFAKIEDKWKITSFVYRTSPDTVASGTPYDLFPTEDETGTDPQDPLWRTLEKEAKGWQESSGGAIASLCTEEFTGYEGYGNADLKTWQVNFSDTDILKAFFKKRFSRAEYEMSRTPVHFSILGDKALVVTAEKGKTSHRATGATREFDARTLWTLVKKGGGWRITSSVGRIAAAE